MLAPPLAFLLPYEYLHKTYRLLWHQTLGTLLRYPRIPRRTINFDLYPINKLRHNNQITLGGVVTTVHEKTIADAIITEIWDAEGIAMEAGFFYELLHLYNNALSPGEHLIWYPKDKTDKAFSIQPLDLEVGAKDEMAVHPVHAVSMWDYRFITSEVRFRFRVRRIFDIPEAVATFEGT